MNKTWRCREERSLRRLRPTTHHSEPARHVVHNPVDGLERAVQQSVRVAEAVEVERLEQQLAVAPQLHAPAADPRLGPTTAAPSLRAAQPAPAQRQSHGPGELPLPAAAQTHAAAAAAATSPLQSTLQINTDRHTHTATVTNAGRVKQQLFRTQPDRRRGFRAHLDFT